MPNATFQRRATAIAVGAGVVILSLSLVVATRDSWTAGDHASALVLLTLCASVGWGAAHLFMHKATGAIDRAVERLAAAAAGDLTTPVPSSTTLIVPRLATAMGALFTQLSTNFDHVRHLALYDPVTGLANRANFRAGAEAVLGRMAEGEPAALFFIDLDRFKAVNDSRGHASGDQLLMRVADRLRAVCDDHRCAGTMVGRLAGDEFTILCPGMGDPAAVQRLGDAVVLSLGQPFPLTDGPVSIGASVGVALRPDHGTTLHDLMRAADAAMYQAKRDGRARMSHYGAGLAAELTGRELLDQELRDALDREEFALVFQPQLAAGDQSLVAAEALLRWRHPSGELRPAGDFLARAEVNGQMIAIGEWVTTAVARAAADWHRAGRPGRIALNLSQRQLEDRAFVPRLRAAFDKSGAPLACIELEIGEAFAMRCPTGTVAALAQLRADGVRITIDDFGAGDSNLQRLRQMPVDRVKLDRTLVREVAHDRVSREIVQALVGLIHGLGFEAIAEGVETEATADVLRVLGCDAIQGWIIARPMDAAALARWLDAPRVRTGGR